MDKYIDTKVDSIPNRYIAKHPKSSDICDMIDYNWGLFVNAFSSKDVFKNSLYNLYEYAIVDNVRVAKDRLTNNKSLMKNILVSNTGALAANAVGMYFLSSLTDDKSLLNDVSYWTELGTYSAIFIALSVSNKNRTRGEKAMDLILEGGVSFLVSYYAYKPGRSALTDYYAVKGNLEQFVASSASIVSLSPPFAYGSAWLHDKLAPIRNYIKKHTVKPADKLIDKTIDAKNATKRQAVNAAKYVRIQGKRRFMIMRDKFRDFDN